MPSQTGTNSTARASLVGCTYGREIRMHRTEIDLMQERVAALEWQVGTLIERLDHETRRSALARGRLDTLEGDR